MVQCSYIGKGFGHIVLIVVGARSRKYMVRRWGISAGDSEQGSQFAAGAEVRTWRSDSGRITQLAAGAEVRTWRSDSGRITQLAAGAEVVPWQSVAGRNTQFAAGAEVRT
ncbi:TPA: hypothetical protein ACQQG3_005643 [Pseudomonas aeruginosa]